MRFNNPPPPKKKHSDRIRFSQPPPPFQTDLRSDSCICFLREVSAVLGCIQSGCHVVLSSLREQMNQRKSLKDSSGSSVNIYLGPSKLKGLNPYNSGVLVLKMTPVLRVQWFSLGIAMSWFFLREECWVLGRVLIIQIRDQRLLVVCSERNNLPYLVGGVNPS